MAKVLLVDTNFSSMPIYSTLNRMGHEVHVVGGNPDDSLAKTASKYWNIDYSSVDLLEKLINSERYEYIVPGCTDRSYSSCAAVNKGNYPGIDSVQVEECLNNKANFRELARKINLPSPQLQTNNFNQLKWPLIVKPVDAFSGKGITVLMEPNERFLEIAIQYAKNSSHKGQYLIEEYVQGVLHSHSSFISNGKIISDYIVREDCTTNPFVVDTSRVLRNPSILMRNKLRDAIEKMASFLKLKDGLVHTQYIYNGEELWLIEVTRRCPGDLYSQLIELSTGCSYVENYVRPFLGMSPFKSAEDFSYKPIMRHTITVREPQNFEYLQFKKNILIERWISLSIVGTNLNPSPANRVGILFVKAKTESELVKIYEDTLKGNLYKISSIYRD